jgi:hypothetical protein
MSVFFNNKLINVRLNKLTLSSKNVNSGKFGYSTNGGKIDPMWVTGFVDAEGCFSIIVEISEALK